MKKIERFVKCTHKDYSYLDKLFDFSELWDGAPETRAHGNWNGGFRGRPALADEFMPAVQMTCKGDKPLRIDDYQSAMRTFWRFLDNYERWCATGPSGDFTSQIEHVEDIDTQLLLLWKLPAPSGEWAGVGRSTYIEVTRLIKRARQLRGLPNLIIPAYPRSEIINRREIPNEKVGRQLVRALVKRGRSIFDRWERADALAAQGRNLLGVGHKKGKKGVLTLVVDGGVTEADLHATYRAAVAANNHLPLSQQEFLGVLGFSKSMLAWWPSYLEGHPEAGKKISANDLSRGIYPDAGDIAVLMLLFIARTGWNQSTVENLDIGADENWIRQYQSNYLYLFSYKERAQEWQDTVSHVRSRTMPYQIVGRVLARTAVLRDVMQATPTLCENAVIACRSPWVYCNFGIGRSTPIAVEPTDVTLRNMLKAVIRESNATNAIQIPEALAPSDLRDIYIGAAYRLHDYSLAVAQIAAGHKHPSTTFNYLRRRAWRAESESSKNALFTALIDHIETHRKIDLTRLRAEMDGIEVTEEMVANLERYRRYMTYSGVACSDPTHPPAFIDGGNPRDGTVPCAQQHQCVLCPKGRVFNDSLPHLARRCAELFWLEENLPLEAFAETTLPYERKVMQATLTQWPHTAVEAQLTHWTQCIQTGGHRVVRFSGEM